MVVPAASNSRWPPSANPCDRCSSARSVSGIIVFDSAAATGNTQRSRGMPWRVAVSTEHRMWPAARSTFHCEQCSFVYGRATTRFGRRRCEVGGGAGGAVPGVRVARGDVAERRLELGQRLQVRVDARAGGGPQRGLHHRVLPCRHREAAVDLDPADDLAVGVDPLVGRDPVLRGLGRGRARDLGAQRAVLRLAPGDEDHVGIAGGDAAGRERERRLLQDPHLGQDRAGLRAEAVGHDAGGVGVRPDALRDDHRARLGEQRRRARVLAGAGERVDHELDRLLRRGRVVLTLDHGADADEHGCLRVECHRRGSVLSFADGRPPRDRPPRRPPLRAGLALGVRLDAGQRARLPRRGQRRVGRRQLRGGAGGVEGHRARSRTPAASGPTTGRCR